MIDKERYIWVTKTELEGEYWRKKCKQRVRKTNKGVYYERIVGKCWNFQPPKWLFPVSTT